jgi:hypothetical protein
MADRDEQLAELGRLWREQPAEPHDTDPEEVLMQIQRDARKFDRIILWRDVRETLAGLAVLAFAVWRSWSEPGWMPWAGVFVLAACMAYTLAHPLRARRRERGIREDATLIERLQSEIEKVGVQADLLRTVRSWYILPIAIGITAWSVGLKSPTGLGGLMPVLLFNATLFSLIGWGVWRLNRYALRADLQPRLRELRSRLDQARAGQA